MGTKYAAPEIKTTKAGESDDFPAFLMLPFPESFPIRSSCSTQKETPIIRCSSCRWVMKMRYGAGCPVAVPDKIFGLMLFLDFVDRCHSLGSLHLPPATLPSLPGLSPAVRVRFLQRINPIVNDTFTMGFIGAGGRTRTGTLSPAVDFESTTSTIPSHRQVCYYFVFPLAT